MDGSPNGAVSAHDQLGRFVNGNSEYRARQKRIAERTAQLCAEYEASPAHRQILAVVARYLDDAERSRTALTRTRAANAAHRLLRSIPRKKPKRYANAAEWYDAE